MASSIWDITIPPARHPATAERHKLLHPQHSGARRSRSSSRRRHLEQTSTPNQPEGCTRAAKNSSCGIPLLWPPTTRPRSGPKIWGVSRVLNAATKLTLTPWFHSSQLLVRLVVRCRKLPATPVHPRITLLSTSSSPVGPQTRTHEIQHAYPSCSASDLRAHIGGGLGTHIARAPRALRPLAERCRCCCGCLPGRIGATKTERGGFRSPVKFLDPSRFEVLQTARSSSRLASGPSLQVQRHVYLGRR